MQQLSPDVMNLHKTYRSYLDLPIDEFTSFEPICVDEQTSFADILNIFDANDIRHLPVVREQKPVGIISERDVRPFRLIAASAYLTARELMVPNPLCVPQGAPLQEVAMAMSEEKIGSALVVNEQQELTGIFTSIDALNALIEVIRGDAEV